MASRKLRVLHVSTWQVPCGIATYCENLVKSLDACGVQNELAPIHPHEWRSFLPADIAEWQQSILDKANGVDLVHVQHEHGLFGYALGSRFATKRFGALVKALRERGTALVTTFHTDICTTRRSGFRSKLDAFRRRRLWTKHVARHFGNQPGQARAIVHSSGTRKSFVKHGFPIDSVTVLHHACLAPRNITMDPVAAKISLGMPAGTKLLAIFGFVGRYKGYLNALDALQKLPENYRLVFVGGSHPESNDGFLDELVRGIPEELAGRVHITGWVDRQTADSYFAATDVCLAPYQGDTMLSGSGAVTWALSSGRPVVASKIEAFQNVNRLGDCMLMVTPDRPGELAWAIQKAATDDSLRARLIANARAFCEKYSWDSSTNQMLDIYTQVAPQFGELTQGDKPLVRIAA